MSRFDGKLEAAAEAALDAAELLAALRCRAGASAEDRANAIACYLSASDGWRDVSQALGGAFAPGVENKSEEPPAKLSSGKDE